MSRVCDRHLVRIVCSLHAAELEKSRECGVKNTQTKSWGKSFTWAQSMGLTAPFFFFDGLAQKRVLTLSAGLGRAGRDTP